ncbi:MAG: formate--tetrahydrofolate ligase [Calditrichaceae bacterium]|nr:formate--tetrahydrofolate ligase [Calditrichaceae bacterium]MBN2709004.1 formate--tetrahydrofolate ligase [Calditrichaceae bacterium]RQV95344.1 MAG: formate--tetrahydrofolate ligase [Calditrichota bacterium]
MRSDIEIARECHKKHIEEIAQTIGLSRDDIIPYGSYIAKIPLSIREKLAEKPDGKLILVTAMTPTPMGEGKTTTTIGLGQALNLIGEKTMIAVREPSLGPCFGLKGGAAGGGYSQVLPMEDINLHFTGDLHAVTIAHNLLSAVIDNHLHQKSAPEIHPRRVIWKRVIDMNDRSLRSIIVGLERQGINGVMREDGFEITAASEVMAVLCLARDLRDLKERLGKIIIGYDSLRKPVLVRDLGVHGAMAVLLMNAINPNLVQSFEGTPVFVHGGPFANIAHGCNTLIATRMALKLADYVVTEAGFGADLGAEKFFDIKCRIGELNPAAAVLVVTKRAYALHGIENIIKHAENIRLFNIPVIVSINRFADDTDEELLELKKACKNNGIEAVITDYRESGGKGGTELAEKLVDLCRKPGKLKFLYDTDSLIIDKIETVAGKIYGASGLELTTTAKKEISQIENLGYGNLPICIAKTPASLTDNPKIPGCPKDFKITVTNAKVSAGAGFVVVYTGEIMTMPGLPKKPAAMEIDIDDNGNITGLF